MSKPFVDRVMNLTQGISRQAPSIRFPGQVDDATNVEFSVVDGARKRKGSALLGFLGSASATNSYRMHAIERDDEEEYVIVYGRGFLQIFDLNTQEPAFVNYEDGALTYLFSGGPTAEEMRFSTVADTTFVVNRRVTPAMKSDGRSIDPASMPMTLVRDSYSASTGARFTMKKGTWPGRSANYQVLSMAEGATGGTFKLKYGDETTLELPFDADAEQIQRAIEGNGYEPNDFLVEERRTVSTTDGDTQTSKTELTGEYINVDLPPDQGTINGKAVAGLGAFNYGKVVVTGGPINDRKVYIRISPDIRDTEAFTVVDNTTTRAIEVSVGDVVNDPPPAFAQNPSTTERRGLPISDISYVRNRLAISADEFVCFSRTDDVFSFFKEEPPALIASDAFDIQLAADDVCIIDRMVQFRGAIALLTRSGQQFEISGLETLSASEAAATPSTKYNTKNALPAQVGERLYMLGEGKGNTRLLEYYYSDAVVSNTSLDVSKHVDDLVPEDSLALVANPNRETVFIVTKLQGDLEPKSFVSECDNDTPLDWDQCATWDNEGIPQPWDTAIIRDGCVVYRQDAEYNESDCVGGLAAHPVFQTATAKRSTCCGDLPVSSRIPCNPSGTSATNCNCFENDTAECRCNSKQRGLFGCHSILSFVTSFFNREDPPVDCDPGRCCIAGECSILCQAACRDLSGTWTTGGSCIGDPCGGVQAPGACCLPSGECTVVNNSGICDFLGGTFNAGMTCDTVTCNIPCNTGETPIPCCLEGNCFMETPTCCTEAGGTPQPALANCASASCPDGPGDGCEPNCGDVGSDYGDPTNAGIAGQMYVYQNYMEGQERKQSAWSKWSFGKDRLMDAVVIDDELITLRKQTLSGDGAGTVLIIDATDLSGSTDSPVVKIGDAEYTWPFPVHMDHLTVINSGIYNADGGYTWWTLSTAARVPTGYTDYEIDTVVQRDGTSHDVISANSGQEIRTAQNVDLTGEVLLMGRRVNAQMTLTESFARDRERKPILDGRTTLKKVVVTHKDSKNYDVIVSSTETNALTRTNSYSASSLEVAGEVVTWTQGNTETTSVTLKSDNPYPNTWTSYEFHGLLSHQIDGSK